MWLHSSSKVFKSAFDGLMDILGSLRFEEFISILATYMCDFIPLCILTHLVDMHFLFDIDNKKEAGSNTCWNANYSQGRGSGVDTV